MMMGDQSGDVGLEIRRVVPAEPERVFDAWTSPGSLRAWWGPPGGSCSHAEVDLRVGGRYVIVNVLADSSTLAISGEFLDVVRPERLSYTWTTGAETGSVEHVTVQFKDHNDGTEVVISHQRTSEEKLPGHTAGWDACLAGLVAHLTEATGAG